MGFQDALFIQNLSYASQEAVDFADVSMEAISEYTIQASIALAKEKGAYARRTAGRNGTEDYCRIDTLALLEQERGGYLDVDRSLQKWIGRRCA